MSTTGHWRTWHNEYDDPASSLSRRLAAVQRRLAAALDEAPPGPVHLISMCAGQGRDVIGALGDHPRRTDVAGRLVELDPELAGQARDAARHAGLVGLEVLVGDASTTSAYAGAVPADIVLVCGVFGNITEVDIRRTIDELRHLSAPGAVVIWTRHSMPPDLTPSVREWFVTGGFEEVAFDTEAGRSFAVGTNRLSVEPLPYRADRQMFTFRGEGSEARF